MPPTLTLGGAPSAQIAVYKPYVDPGATATDALGRSLAVMVVGLPGSASNFTATVTTSPIIVTYTASDAANRSVTAVRSLTVYDPCGPAERTCSSTTFACSINRNCGAVAASLVALLSSSAAGGDDGSRSSSSSSSAMMTGSITVNAAAVAAAAAATTLLFATPDVTPPVIQLLGTGQSFVTPAGGSGLIASVLVGSTYEDSGALALKVPSNTLLPTVYLTTSIVTTGEEAVITAAPTLPSQPFVVRYDVRDNAEPPNSAATVHRRVQVVCRADEVVCTHDDGSLSCSYGGICMGVPPSLTPAAVPQQPASMVVVPSPAEVPAVVALPAAASIVDQGYRRVVSVVRRQPARVGLVALPAGRSKKIGGAAVPVSHRPWFDWPRAGMYPPLSSAPLFYELTYSPLFFDAIIPVLTLNGPTPVTVSANEQYAPCMGTVTSNCEMGATATLNTAGDFNGRIRACADLVRPTGSLEFYILRRAPCFAPFAPFDHPPSN